MDPLYVYNSPEISAYVYRVLGGDRLNPTVQFRVEVTKHTTDTYLEQVFDTEEDALSFYNAQVSSWQE